MKFFTAILVVLLSLNLYSQADLDLTLTFITDPPQYNTTIINFGLDSTATNGIDPWLGEFAYPPDGCEGPGGVITCISFCLPPPFFNEDISPRDYRYGVLPYSGQVEHRLYIHLGYNVNLAEMFWDFPEGLSVHLEDIFGGLSFQLDIQDTGSFVFTDSLLYAVYQEFKMIINYDNIIPIELKSFTASVLQSEKAVQLNWTTATETNNSGFEIERLQDSKIERLKDWEAIGFVPGFGTTTEPKSYSYIDENVTTSIYKYRLKQIDFDGSFEYFNEIEVIVDFTPKEFVLYQNYPNPFNPSTTIKFEIPSVIASEAKQSQFVTLRVYDILGNEVATLVNEEKQPGVYEVEFGYQVSHSGEVRNLTSGVYFYELKVGNFKDTNKMILAK
jgi:hypothetical protein